MKSEFLEFPDFSEEPTFLEELKDVFEPNVAELLSQISTEVLSIQVHIPFSHDKTQRFRGPVITKKQDNKHSDPWVIDDAEKRHKTFVDALIYAVRMIDCEQRRMVQDAFEEMMEKEQ